MTEKNELSSDEVVRADRYKETLKQMYLEALASNGYDQGFDFDTVSVDVSYTSGYAVPRFSGRVHFREDIIYIPEGVKYDAFFEFSFIEKKDGVEIVKYDREHYESSGIKEIQESLEEREAKGPYPGSKYFLAELDRIDQSLKHHKPQLFFGDGQIVELEKPLGAGMEGLIESDAAFCERTANTVLIFLPVQAMPFLYEAVTFVYNIETGEISEVTRVPPPALA